MDLPRRRSRLALRSALSSRRTKLAQRSWESGSAGSEGALGALRGGEGAGNCSRRSSVSSSSRDLLARPLALCEGGSLAFLCLREFGDGRRLGWSPDGWGSDPGSEAGETGAAGPSAITVPGGGNSSGEGTFSALAVEESSVSEDTNPLLLLAKRPRRAPSPEGGPTSERASAGASSSPPPLNPSVYSDPYGGEQSEAGETHSEADDSMEI